MTPTNVSGIRSCAALTFTLIRKYTSKVTPRTQPTCGLDKKTKYIVINRPSAAASDRFFLTSNTRKISTKASGTQNPTAASRKPRIDQTKLLGINA